MRNGQKKKKKGGNLSTFTIGTARGEGGKKREKEERGNLPPESMSVPGTLDHMRGGKKKEKKEKGTSNPTDDDLPDFPPKRKGKEDIAPQAS